MTRIQFQCDRCHQLVEGGYYNNFTAGFYNVAQPNEEIGAPGGAWAQFGKEGEIFVCDACIHKMPEYRAIYGDQPVTVTQRQTMGE